MTLNTQAIYPEMVMPTPDGARKLVRRMRTGLSEEGVIDFVSKTSPWIAPLPSAFFVHTAAVNNLHADPGLAWVIAVVIETLGLTTTHTALGMHTWNQGHRDQPEKQAPFGLAIALAVTYVLATLSLITVLEVLPEMQHYAPAMFPILAVVGAVNLAIRSHHNRRILEEKALLANQTARVEAREDDEHTLRVEEKRMRMIAKYGVDVARAVTFGPPQSVTQSVPLLSDMPNVTPNVTADATKSVTSASLTMKQRQEALLGYLEEHGDPGASELARIFSVNRKTIYRDLEALGLGGKQQDA